MGVVRLVLWLIALVAFVVFAITNWTAVPLVFGTTEVVIRLPVLLLGVLLIGFLPMYLVHRWSRRRWAQRTLAAATSAYAPLPATSAVEHPDAVSFAQPTIVPPGCG